MQKPLHIGIDGASGRMGRAILELVEKEPEHFKAAALFSRLKLDHPAYCDDINKLNTKVDVLIDFTSPQKTLSNLDFAVKHGLAMVIGTTGLNLEEEERLSEAAKHVPIVFASNMSIGVNVLLELLKQASQMLPNDFDIEIIEAHHRYKKDAPSGTALSMGKAIAAEKGWKLEQHAEFSRNGQDCVKRPDSIGFSVIRGGDIIGEHTAMYASDFERVELTHKASSRLVFAEGALKAARFVACQKPGLYSMNDVIRSNT